MSGSTTKVSTRSSNVPCRYWTATGKCFFGDQCNFVHALTDKAVLGVKEKGSKHSPGNSKKGSNSRDYSSRQRNLDTNFQRASNSFSSGGHGGAHSTSSTPSSNLKWAPAGSNSRAASQAASSSKNQLTNPSPNSSSSSSSNSTWRSSQNPLAAASASAAAIVSTQRPSSSPSLPTHSSSSSSSPPLSAAGPAPASTAATSSKSLPSSSASSPLPSTLGLPGPNTPSPFGASSVASSAVPFLSAPSAISLPPQASLPAVAAAAVPATAAAAAAAATIAPGTLAGTFSAGATAAASPVPAASAVVPETIDFSHALSKLEADVERGVSNSTSWQPAAQPLGPAPSTNNQPAGRRAPPASLLDYFPPSQRFSATQQPASRSLAGDQTLTARGAGKASVLSSADAAPFVPRWQPVSATAATLTSSITTSATSGAISATAAASLQSTSATTGSRFGIPVPLPYVPSPSAAIVAERGSSSGSGGGGNSSGGGSNSSGRQSSETRRSSSQFGGSADADDALRPEGSRGPLPSMPGFDASAAPGSGKESKESDGLSFQGTKSRSDAADVLSSLFLPDCNDPILGFVSATPKEKPREGGKTAAATNWENGTVTRKRDRQDAHASKILKSPAGVADAAQVGVLNGSVGRRQQGLATKESDDGGFGLQRSTEVTNAAVNSTRSSGSSLASGGLTKDAPVFLPSSMTRVVDSGVAKAASTATGAEFLAAGSGTSNDVLSALYATQSGSSSSSGRSTLLAASVVATAAGAVSSEVVASRQSSSGGSAVSSKMALNPSAPVWDGSHSPALASAASAATGAALTAVSGMDDRISGKGLFAPPSFMPPQHQLPLPSQQQQQQQTRMPLPPQRHSTPPLIHPQASSRASFHSSPRTSTSALPSQPFHHSGPPSSMSQLGSLALANHNAGNFFYPPAQPQFQVPQMPPPLGLPTSMKASSISHQMAPLGPPSAAPRPPSLHGHLFPPLMKGSRNSASQRGYFPPGKGPLSSQFMEEGLRSELHRRSSLVYAQVNPQQESLDLPESIAGRFHTIYPLEEVSSADDGASSVFGVRSIVVKAISSLDGCAYALRRIDGRQVIPTAELAVSAREAVERWAVIGGHPQVSILLDAFISSDMEESAALCFAHEFYPGAVSLQALYLANRGHSSRLAPSLISEDLLWSLLVQLVSGLRAIHAAGLFCRPGGLHPSKVLLTDANRVRIGSLGVLDVLNGDPADDPRLLQREDLASLGRLLLSLAGGPQQSLDFMAAHFSADICRITQALLASAPSADSAGGAAGEANGSSSGGSSAAVGMAGARMGALSGQGGMSGGGLVSIRQLSTVLADRMFAEVDQLQLQRDRLTEDMAKECENGRLLRLIVKLGMVNERPDTDVDPSWAETGDRYLLKLFRHFLFHQISEDGTPLLDWGHIIEALNKLDVGVQERITLMSPDERSMLIVTYEDLKKCIDKSYSDLSSRVSGGRVLKLM